MNINGVTVLAQEELLCTPAAVSVIVFILVAFTAVALILGIYKENRPWIVSSICSISVCIVISILTSTGTFDRASGLCEYKCIIDDGASIHEIFERYEFVDQDGLIWTLKDREDN